MTILGHFFFHLAGLPGRKPCRPARPAPSKLPERSPTETTAVTSPHPSRIHPAIAQERDRGDDVTGAGRNGLAATTPHPRLTSPSSRPRP